MKSFEFLLLVAALLWVQSCNTNADNGRMTIPEQDVLGKARPVVGRGSHVTGELIVRFVDSADLQKIDSVVSSINAVIVRAVSEKRNTFLIKIPDYMSVQDAIKELVRKKEVVYAEPNLIYKLMEGK